MFKSDVFLVRGKGFSSFFFVGFFFFNETLFTLLQTVQYVNNNLKRSKKTHQVEVIVLFLAKVATLRILSKDFRIFQYSLLILYQIHLARILQYASTLVMAPLPCNS